MTRQLRFPGLFLALLLLATVAAAHPGVGLVRDSKGNIFYTDLEHVWQITPAGKKQIAVKNVHTHELYLDAQDNLFGEDVRYEGEKTDCYHHRIWQRLPNGQIREVLKERPGFRNDHGFVRDRLGNEYWLYFEKAEALIRKRNAQGKVVTLKPAKPLGHLSALAVTPDGATLYVTSATGFHQLNAAGKVTTLIPNSKAARHALFGIWPEQEGSVYVADYAQRAIKKVDKNGKVTKVTETPAPWGPTGLLFAPDKTLWLLEYSATNKVRVRKITPGGKTQIF